MTALYLSKVSTDHVLTSGVFIVKSPSQTAIRRDRKFAVIMLCVYGVFALLLAFFPDVLAQQVLNGLPASLIVGPAIIVLGIVLAAVVSFQANRGYA